MLRGMVGSIMGRLAGDDPVVLQAMRADTEMMHRMADPRMVLAMESLHADPEKLMEFQDDPEVMELLESVARLTGGSSYATQRRLEDAQLSRAEIAEDSGEEEAEESEEGEDDPEMRAHRREAKRRFAEAQWLRSESVRRELTTKAAPLTYDIADWRTRPWFERSSLMGQKLMEKGFCVLQGSLDAKMQEKAIVEAQRLQRSGGFTRPPREVLSGLFGDIGSAWTRELSDPNQPAPPEDEMLRSFDYQLEELGGEIAGVTETFFGMTIKGRTVGVAHLSRMATDSVNPPLVDAEEADGYMMLFMRKKVKMIYYVGPGPASMRISPMTDEVNSYKTTLEAGTIVALRGDVCSCLIDPLASQAGLIVEIDFLATEKLGPLENARDRVPPPEELLLWYEHRLRAIVEHDITDSVPEDWVKLARINFFKASKAPNEIAGISHNLPATAHPGESWKAPFAACSLGGSDCISEIPNSKWDMSVYYDEDPMNVDNFKMYTRHIGVIPGGFDFSPSDFGLTAVEAANVDPRYIKLCQSTLECLQLAGLSKDYPKGKDIGVFFGMTGNEMQYQLITREVRLSKSSWVNTNNATIVNRLTYLLGSTGPGLSVDTEDSSGSAALDNAVTSLRLERCAMALVGSVNLIQHPLSLIVHCAAGTISWTGRCRVFDESSDGVVRSEAAASVILRQRMPDADDQPLAMVMGSGLNSKGVSSSLTAPSGPAIHDVLQRALRDASYPAGMIQGVDLNASGYNLADTVEMAVMQKELLSPSSSSSGSDSSTRSTVVLRNFKSVHGEVGGPGGLASLARAIFFHSRAVHGPSLHLHELSEIIENVSEEDDSAVLGTTNFTITTECLEAANAAQHAGINSFSTSGTNVHHIVWGIKPLEDRPVYQGQPLQWFPTCGDPVPQSEAADSEVSLPEQAEYHIIGSWNAWAQPHKMQEESPGVWSYVIKLSENRFETFQIWLDGDKERVLHPRKPRAGPDDFEVLGPTAHYDGMRLFAWAINGRPDKVRLVNEEQMQHLADTLNVDDWQDMDCTPMPVFSGSYKPEGHESAEDINSMPTMVRNAEFVGTPGDMYKVRLRLGSHGKFRRVEWSKLDASYPPRLAQDFPHAYYIAGDFSFWNFTQMEVAGEGSYTGRVRLLENQTEFQISRDKDLDQIFCPRKADLSGQDAGVRGPMAFGLHKSWKIQGEPGDVFKVTFTRKPLDRHEDDLSISWEFVVNEPSNPETFKDFRYFIVGSWSDFGEKMAMEPTEDRSVFTADVKIGPSSRESFNILFNGNWLSVVHPNTPTASFRDADHELQGPDRQGSCNYWVIGKDAEDAAEPGSCFRIILHMAEDHPRKIKWKKLTPTDWGAVVEAAIAEVSEVSALRLRDASDSGGEEEEAAPRALPAPQAALEDAGGQGPDA